MKARLDIGGGFEMLNAGRSWVVVVGLTGALGGCSSEVIVPGDNPGGDGGGAGVSGVAPGVRGAPGAGGPQGAGGAQGAGGPQGAGAAPGEGGTQAGSGAGAPGLPPDGSDPEGDVTQVSSDIIGVG